MKNLGPIILIEGRDNEVGVRFNFGDPDFDFNEVLGAVRGLPRKKYHPDTKTWVMPRSVFPQLCNILHLRVPEGFEQVEPDNRVVIELGKDFFTLSPELDIRESRLGRMLYFRRNRDAFHVAEILEEKGYEVSIKGFYPHKGLKMEKNVQLYPFQEEAVEEFLLPKKRGLIGFDMGLGKTVLALEFARRAGMRSIMVLAPGALLGQWKSELEKHFGYHGAVTISGKVQKRKRLQMYANPFVIASYDILKFDLEDLAKKGIYLHYDLLILDEVQKVKNWDTQRAAAVSKVVAPYVLGLSGTPVENKLEELYFVADQIVPAYFGGYTKFKQKYMIQDNWGSVIGYRGLEEVYESLQGLMIRKKAEEVGEQLPEVVELEYRCDLTSEEKQLFNSIAEKDKGLGTLQELKACSSNPLYYAGEFAGESSKEKLFEEIINEELADRQVIVFTQFKRNLLKLEKLVRDRPVFVLSGDSRVDMADFAEEFRNTPKAVLLMTEVGVHGLNLQTASAVVNYDLPWNPSNLKQRIGRVRRLKSEHDTILAINLISNNTLDDYILKLLSSKVDLFNATVEGVQKMVMDDFWGQDTE